MSLGQRLCRQVLEDRLIREGVADFNKYEREYVLDLVLVNTSPLHIGAGGTEFLGSPVDLSVLRGTIYIPGRGLYEGPVIPGSSLKGVLRSIAEGLAAKLGWLRIEPVTLNDSSITCTGENLADIENKLLSKDCNEERERELSRLFNDCLASPVVGLFGAPWIGSHVEIYDAYPANLEPPRISVVTRVSIDRVTGSQKPGQLYSMEIVEAGTKWKTRMRILNIDVEGDSREAKLLRMVLRALEQGISIGRRTSIGQGSLRLVVGESSLTKVEIDPERAEFVRTVIPLDQLLKG